MRTMWLIVLTFYTLNLGSQTLSNNPNRSYQSTEVMSDGKLAFRIYAPEAKEVKLIADGIWEKVEFRKDSNGVWEGIYSKVAKGAYHYHFVVDGVNVYDPKASSAAETKALLLVGDQDDFFMMKNDIPHGALSQRHYYSSTLNEMRRLHVWTPAGFERSRKKLPVLYLIHGGGGTDLAWPTIGCAANILDKLMVEGKIEPMIVVMPNGTIETDNILDRPIKFKEDFLSDLIPFIEDNYPVYSNAKNRAIMGLSMGGLETLEAVISSPKDFGYVGVLSSGWWLSETWEKQRGTIDDKLSRASQLKTIAGDFNASNKLMFFTQGGPEDLAYENGLETLKLFDAAGIDYKYSESPGGHTWLVWRKNLWEIAPLLFK